MSWAVSHVLMRASSLADAVVDWLERNLLHGHGVWKATVAGLVLGVALAWAGYFLAGFWISMALFCLHFLSRPFRAPEAMNPLHDHLSEAKSTDLNLGFLIFSASPVSGAVLGAIMPGAFG